MIKKILSAERTIQLLSLLTSAFLIVYLLTYVSQARQRQDCQEAVNSALISSVEAGREAATIENIAMDDLLHGLLTPPDGDAREILAIYQARRSDATRIRVDNPYPNPHCD